MNTTKYEYVHVNKIGFLHRCRICFKNIRSVEKHITVYHPNVLLATYMKSGVEFYRGSCPEQTAAAALRPPDQQYTCNLCGQCISDFKSNGHHFKCLQKAVATFKVKKQYTCNACDEYVSDFGLSHHHFKYHPHIPLAMDDNNNDESAEQISMDGQQYRCRACAQNVCEGDLDRHHSKYHSDVPMDADIFEVAG